MQRNMYQLVLLLLLALTTGCALVNDNLRRVEPGECYRSAQMSRGRLEYVITKHHIKTIVNLQGASPGARWYDDELAVCKERGVTHYDLKWTMSRIPDPQSLQQLVDWFEHSGKPILVHCQAGVHRAGVAAASYRLFKGASPDQARKQFGAYFHHAPIGQLVEMYRGSDKPFAEWVRTDYPKAYEDHLRTEGAK